MAIVDYFVDAARLLDESVLSPLLDPIQSRLAAEIEKLAPSLYQSAERYLVGNKSIHAHQLPLLNPLQVVFLILCYMVIVFGGKFVMKNFVGQRLNVKLISNVHNGFLVWLSGYMAMTIAWEAWVNRRYSLFDNPAETSRESFQLAKYIWLFYFSKVFEFVDTFIMVMKMNFHQISFLHVYHHASIFSIWWLITWVAPTGEAYFSAILNSLIHVVMYSYYLLSSLGVARSLTRSVKPFITMGQMTQFCVMMTQASYDIWAYSRTPEDKKYSKYPVELSALLWVYMWTMLGLFANFYFKSYTGKKPQKQEKPKFVKEE